MFNWKIESILVKPEENGRTDVVAMVHWRCSTNENGQYGVCYGNMAFVAGETFIAFQDLTQEQILDWCFANGVDKTKVEEIAASSLANKINVPTVGKLPPWRNDL
jgi:hypothetical protein